MQKWIDIKTGHTTLASSPWRTSTTTLNGEIIIPANVTFAGPIQNSNNTWKRVA